MHPSSHTRLARLSGLLLACLVVVALAVPAAQASGLMGGASTGLGVQPRLATHTPPQLIRHEMSGRSPAAVRGTQSDSIGALSLAVITVGTALVTGVLIAGALLLVRSRSEEPPECRSSLAGC